MKRTLLEFLRSSEDGSEFRLDGEEGNDGEILSGALIDAPGNRYEIVDGIPLFAADQADDPTFGFKWRIIGDSYGHEEPSRSSRRQWYVDRFGFGSEMQLRAFLAERGPILDAGCGSGVDSALFADSDATVVAVDLSRDAAAATYRRLGARPNVHVVQADIHRLPFARASFGYVSSDQVLHHTPDTRRAFEAVRSYVAPGGFLATYVYNRKAPLREFADDYIRERTTQMSNEECWEFSRKMALLGRELARSDTQFELPEPIDLLEMPAGSHDVQRFLYWNVVKCFWNEDFDEELNIAVNFDWYHPSYAHRHTVDEVTEWLADEELVLERLNEVESGIASVARG